MCWCGAYPSECYSATRNYNNILKSPDELPGDFFISIDPIMVLVYTVRAFILNSMLGYDWKMRTIIIVQNLIIIGIFVGGGLFLDKQLDTGYLFMVIGLIVSFVLNQAVSYFIIKKRTKNMSNKIDSFPQEEKEDTQN